MAATIRPPAAGIDRGVGSTPTPGVHTDGSRTVIVLRGEWDLSNRAILAEVLSRVIASDLGDVVIDLAEASFIDTATVRAFVDGCEFLKRRGRALTFRSPSVLAAKMLGMFGLTDLIERRHPNPAMTVS